MLSPVIFQEHAFESSQKYKEGKFIIELAHMIKDNGWDWGASSRVTAAAEEVKGVVWTAGLEGGSRVGLGGGRLYVLGECVTLVWLIYH